MGVALENANRLARRDPQRLLEEDRSSRERRARRPSPQQHPAGHRLAKLDFQGASIDLVGDKLREVSAPADLARSGGWDEKAGKPRIGSYAY
jgi:hypothetical protein